MQVPVSLKIDIEATASVSHMEQRIQEAGQQAMREAFQHTMRQWEDQRRPCPHGGEKLSRLEGTVSRTIATIFGRVKFALRRFRCQSCQHRWCPAKGLLAGLKGRMVSDLLAEAAGVAGASWPYRTASRVLNKLCGAQISREEIRRLAHEQGRSHAEHQQAEAQRVCEERSQQMGEAQPARPPMLVGLDGGWVCSREKRGGMEGKVAVIGSQVENLPMPAYSTTFSWSDRSGRRRPPKPRHRLRERRSVATFAPSQQLGALAEAAARRLSEDPTRPMIVIADGANWIKKEQERHFPQATCILDWAHLWREVSQAIRATARAKSLSGRERDSQLSLHQTWLWSGDVDHALRGFHALSMGLPAEEREAIKRAITYLEHQRCWIGSYEHWRQQSYPVGSGMIERAVSLVINRRMKKRGMRWCRANATAVVALRTDLLNDDWLTPEPLRTFP